MLYTIAVIALVLWILALLGGYLMGGLINILLGFSIIMVLIDVFRKRKRLVKKSVHQTGRTEDPI
jgi:hypothetical protein